MIKFVMTSFTQNNKHQMFYKTKKQQNCTRNNTLSIYKLNKSSMNILVTKICVADLLNLKLKQQATAIKKIITQIQIQKQINKQMNQVEISKKYFSRLGHTISKISRSFFVPKIVAQSINLN
ncbi:hypothetical protein TTHERM_00275869 (macronuclear) [Tetrahymena thermophila SB210]|uniref:Uncharacterized protein n=1 Tax=Tetrahymena thermophila (strain SB210) TaxID=312017 RepID=A4VDW4_TETTS|nr:hypothetical protein TTHERM_00275869 [Tetrahymena thermophila SB210]EDK31728.1 hypothetical protein TTHERM_00275869 [Tetrahymena thermophila SB210]|eukprot:XP_001470792.1 hypothetical protein TTHERM_00275869 [Tetrahymena thermophila SB210]